MTTMEVDLRGRRASRRPSLIRRKVHVECGYLVGEDVTLVFTIQPKTLQRMESYLCSSNMAGLPASLARFHQRDSPKASDFELRLEPHFAP